MSVTLPAKVLRRALVLVGPPTPPATWTIRDLELVAEAIEEQGFVVVPRSELVALRDAAQAALRWGATSDAG